MVLQKSRPSREVTALQPLRELEEAVRQLEDSFGWPSMFESRRFPMEEREWVPAIDMYEQSNKFVVKAELPGIKEQDIEVSVSDNTLTIKGERKTEREVKEENYYRSERAYGRFFRSIPLPANADTQKVQANYDNGVLEISIPKTAETQPKKIQITKK